MKKTGKDKKMAKVLGDYKASKMMPQPKKSSLKKKGK